MNLILNQLLVGSNISHNVQFTRQWNMLDHVRGGGITNIIFFSHLLNHLKNFWLNIQHTGFSLKKLYIQCLNITVYEQVTSSLYIYIYIYPIELKRIKTWKPIWMIVLDVILNCIVQWGSSSGAQSNAEYPSLSLLSGPLWSWAVLSVRITFIFPIEKYLYLVS